MKRTGLRKAARLAAVMTAALMLCLAATVGSFAESNFIIRDYDVSMVVNEDDTYQITETVKVEFTEPSHGIYVNIPLTANLDRDGQKSEYAVRIRDFELLTDQSYSTETEAG